MAEPGEPKPGGPLFSASGGGSFGAATGAGAFGTTAPGAPGSFAAPAASAFGASSTAAFGASLALQDPAALPACGAPPGGGAFSASRASSPRRIRQGGRPHRSGKVPTGRFQLPHARFCCCTREQAMAETRRLGFRV